MDNASSSDRLPIKLYRSIPFPPVREETAETIIAKFRVFLPDRPGSLALFASDISRTGGNISFFHYDRSANSNRVVVEVQFNTSKSLNELLSLLEQDNFPIDHADAPNDDVLVTTVDSVLEINVRLANKPGELASFARLLADHDANVIYMLYDEDIDAEAAHVAVATGDPKEIDKLLKAINEAGRNYRVLYRGSGEQEAANIIGLKMVEKFLLRLKKLLPSSDLAEIKSLVESSRDLQQDLTLFASEAGKDLEAGDVFETVLSFASRSRSSINDKFKASVMGPLRFPGNVALWGFRLPTSENIYLFHDNDELTMIDSGHGIYYDDLKKLLVNHEMDPSKVWRIYVTHPDTDHAGSSGYFEQEFGTRVFMHPGSAEVVSNMNRAHGTTGNLLNLNKYYTRLSVRFTECRFPEQPHYFKIEGLTMTGGFRTIDRFMIGPLLFEVLESHGGHTPGLVFYLNRAFGLLFTSDFLLNVKSLTPEDKEHLGIYRYLLTTPNKDSRIYREETAALRKMMIEMDADLKKKGSGAIIFPGHGEYYAAAELIDQ